MGIYSCPKSILVNVHTLIAIACTLPVTSACAERSISSLRRIKAYLRSAMSTQRFSGLFLLYMPPQVILSHLVRKSLTILQKQKSSNEKLREEGRRGLEARSSVVKNVSLPKGDAAGDGSLNLLDNSSQVRVFNDAGEDVTPRALIPIMLDQYANRARGSVTVENISYNLLQQLSENISQVSWLDSAADQAPGSVGRSGISSVTRITAKIASEANLSVDHEEQTEGESTVELASEEVIEMQLMETDTMWFVNIPSVVVPLETSEASFVVQRNQDYVELCKNRAGNELYVEKGMVTYHGASVAKMTQTEQIDYAATSSAASESDIYDSFQQVTAPVKDPDRDKKAETASDDVKSDEKVPAANDVSSILKLYAVKKSLFFIERVLSINTNQDKLASYRGFEIHMEEDLSPPASSSSQEVETKSMSVISLSQMYDTKEPSVSSVAVAKQGPPGAAPPTSKRATQAAGSAKESTSVMDTVSSGEGEEEDEKGGEEEDSGETSGILHVEETLVKLWAYNYPVTVGRNVSCMVWSKTNPDLLAVGHCEFEFRKQSKGLICCWSVKNMDVPERVYETEVGVTALAFSHATPNILAVSFYDGVIALYDVNSKEKGPLMDTKQVTGRHIGPVWQIMWIKRTNDASSAHPEKLTSVSADGSVALWVRRTALECHIIQKLKRQEEKPTSEIPQRFDSNPVSILASGTCFDFCPSDENLYVVGTEDGNIHKCMCSHTEQYIDSFFLAHVGPVYGVRWSPFHHNIFASCGGDWYLRIWHQDELHPAISLSSDTKSVIDLSWSPLISTVIASLTEAALEIWDLGQSTLDPVVVMRAPDRVKFARALFATNADCILVGDSNGNVTVYKYLGFVSPPLDQEETLIQIVQVALAATA